MAYSATQLSHRPNTQGYTRLRMHNVAHSVGSDRVNGRVLIAAAKTGLGGTHSHTNTYRLNVPMQQNTFPARDQTSTYALIAGASK